MTITPRSKTKSNFTHIYEGNGGTGPDIADGARTTSGLLLLLATSAQLFCVGNEGTLTEPPGISGSACTARGDDNADPVKSGLAVPGTADELTTLAVSRTLPDSVATLPLRSMIPKPMPVATCWASISTSGSSGLLDGGNAGAMDCRLRPG